MQLELLDVAEIVKITHVAEIVKLSHVAEIVKLTHVARILEAGSMYDRRYICRNVFKVFSPFIWLQCHMGQKLKNC